METGLVKIELEGQKIIVRTNLMARVSQIQGHEIRIVLYARLDDNDCLLY